MTKRTRELELSVAEVRDESRKGVEAARQAAAGKAGLSDLEVCVLRPECFFAANMLICRQRSIGGVPMLPPMADVTTKSRSTVVLNHPPRASLPVRVENFRYVRVGVASTSLDNV